MIRTMSNPSALWLMRKHFALQTAATIFLSYVACLSNRTPSRFHFSLKTGLMYMSEVLPGKHSLLTVWTALLTIVIIALDGKNPTHKCPEKVPFRLTPNMQHFITPAGVEGLLTSGVMAIARSLSMPEFDLESSLSLFLRDEVCRSRSLIVGRKLIPISAYVDIPLVHLTCSRPRSPSISQSNCHLMGRALCRAGFHRTSRRPYHRTNNDIDLPRYQYATSGMHR